MHRVRNVFLAITVATFLFGLGSGCDDTVIRSPEQDVAAVDIVDDRNLQIDIA